MTADEAAFLARIREEPDADLPRLVFADYLEEQGHEGRAQFIRAQIELASLTEDSPRRRELAWHCRQYIEGESELDIPQAFEFARPRFGRGLIEYAEFWDEPVAAIAEAFRAAPLRRIWVWVDDDRPFPRKEIPADNCLRTLDLTGTELSANALRFLWQDMTFPRLTELVLTSCELSDLALEALFAYPQLATLERIHLGGNPFTPEGRAELRAHFGDRVTFDCEGDPNRLYAFNQDYDSFTVGFGNGPTQHLVTLWGASVRVAKFDHAGNLLRLEEQPHPQAPARIPPPVLTELGHSPATIRVKRFQFSDGGGITPYSSACIEPLDDPGLGFTEREREDAREWLSNWLGNGNFRWQWTEENEDWLNRDGEIVYTI